MLLSTRALVALLAAVAVAHAAGAAPYFSPNLLTMSLAENLPNNTRVDYIIGATDSEGDPLTYSITAGNEARKVRRWVPRRVRPLASPRAPHAPALSLRVLWSLNRAAVLAASCPGACVRPRGR
jgi:hypothetical protein